MSFWVLDSYMLVFPNDLTLFVPMCSILKQSTIVFRLTHL